MITYRTLRQMYLDFHASKGHAVIPSSSLVPKEDPTVLFNTAGMQPIIPYLLGTCVHPKGNMLVNSQKCIRTDDILEVGDNRHLTFFEMLGNWSIGAYFKTEIIQWSMEFLTSKDWLNLDPNRVFVTVYQGNQEENVPLDTIAIDLWAEEYKKLGIISTTGPDIDMCGQVHRIRQMSGKDNWWGLPYRGPCGPCSEMYYLLPGQPIDFEKSILPNLTKAEQIVWVEENIVEIGNNVFMEYLGEWGQGKEPTKLEQSKAKNIDTGLGLERFLAIINGKNTVYETDLFEKTLLTIDKFMTK
jgi:alanyl-tRNA synthetase